MYVCHVYYRVNVAEYVICILVVASQEYVNTDSTRSLGSPGLPGLAPPADTESASSCGR